jgi:hypothetical protein
MVVLLPEQRVDAVAVAVPPTLKGLIVTVTFSLEVLSHPLTVWLA